MDRKMTGMIHVSQSTYAGYTKNDCVETSVAKTFKLSLDFICTLHPQCKVTILIAHLCKPCFEGVMFNPSYTRTVFVQSLKPLQKGI